ncbi:MAG: pyrroline-5-carboxylate reductase [Bacteroidales bacterium]|nr:pyrroline-5-carboxylate reductase [Bacteroidales bacterium]
MKISIIGCGNMGGAIAAGLASNHVFAHHNTISASNRTEPKLDKLRERHPNVETTTNNCESALGADVIIVAVKPWLIDTVAKEILCTLRSDQIIVSVVAGVPIEHLREIFTEETRTPTIFRAIPNTAISIGESMTVIAHDGASEEQVDTVVDIFNLLGKVAVIEERLMGAATALCSCGTAYALRYVRAAVEGAVELGLYPAQAQAIVEQTVKGAVMLLQENGTHPEAEIDRVTTPGGITIKGLNRMEACGFTNAVVEGLKASVK